MKIFSVIAILEHFLLLKALKDSKIPYLFLTDLARVEFHGSQKVPCYLIFCDSKNESTELSLENNLSSFKRNLG